MEETNTTTPPESSSNSSSNNSSTIKIVGALVVIALLGFAVWEFGLKGANQEENAMEGANATPSVVPESDAMVAAYKDGTYSAVGEYTNPASKEEVDVSVTITDGKITDATFKGTPDNPTTTKMQTNFNEGFKEVVVGKPVDEVSLTVVNGSSLTPQGFMDALSKIKTQAQG